MKTVYLGMAALMLVMTASTAPSQHDRDVALEVRTQLDAAFATPGNVAIATRIQVALAHVTAERDKSGRSRDEVLRDAEYYLHGLYGGAARDWGHILPTLGTPAYNALKWAALRCRDAGFPDLEKLMRTKPDNPVSEPGGAAWAFRGLRDGYKQDGKKAVGPGSSNTLSLPALGDVIPCAVP